MASYFIYVMCIDPWSNHSPKTSWITGLAANKAFRRRRIREQKAGVYSLGQREMVSRENAIGRAVGSQGKLGKPNSFKDAVRFEALLFQHSVLFQNHLYISLQWRFDSSVAWYPICPSQTSKHSMKCSRVLFASSWGGCSASSKRLVAKS